MSNYSQSYKIVSQSLLQSNEKQIREWAKGHDELGESCRMMIEAAGNSHE